MGFIHSVLYMPDGNRRFAEKNSIPLSESYDMGGKTLELFSEFFVAECRADNLVYYWLSSYTNKRTDSSLEAIYNSAAKTLENLFEEDFFKKNKICFNMQDYSGKLPEKIKNIVDKLYESTKNEKNGNVIVLSGYSLEADYNQALFKKPENYIDLRKKLIFPLDIDLVIRNLEMRLSGGPVYAMSQSQMIILNKANPEIKRDDLEILWDDYCRLKGYRISSNPHHITLNLSLQTSSQ